MQALIEGQVACAMFGNVHFLNALCAPETDGGRQRVDGLRVAFEAGRRLAARRALPELTDEAIENRLLLVLAASGDDDWRSAPRRMLGLLAERFLTAGHDGSIRVRSSLLEIWHDLICVVPPGLIVAAWIAPRLAGWSREMPRSALWMQTAREKVQRLMCHSFLPADDDPTLDLLAAEEGFEEVHMHLNGTTEAERVWIDAMRRPLRVGAPFAKAIDKERYVRHIDGAWNGAGLARLLAQEDPHLTGATVVGRLFQANALRAIFEAWVHERHAGNVSRQVGRARRLVRQPHLRSTKRCEGRNLDQRKDKTASPPVVEDILSLSLLMQALEARGDRNIEIALHEYCLLRAQFCRLIVQQTEQNGFDQFQYITINQLREYSEEDYAERFRQIERDRQKPITFLEGRVSPKDTLHGNQKLIGTILRGYGIFLAEGVPDSARGTAERKGAESPTSGLVAPKASLTSEIGRIRALESASTRRLRLGLTAHFIKRDWRTERRMMEDESGPRPACRHAELRHSLDQRARALAALLRATPGVEHFMLGYDAASNERHAPPEVFAPAFRRLRCNGATRFTYHVGEDFAHIASGLRAMIEAVDFLQLGAGCRIGHGTAAGLDPEIWAERVGGFVAMTLEDRIDDLVFARLLLREHGDPDGASGAVTSEIVRLCASLPGWEKESPDTLERAWAMRGLDPTGSDDVLQLDTYRATEAKARVAHRQRDSDGYRLFRRRHGDGATPAEMRARRKRVAVDLNTDPLTSRTLMALQEAVLSRLQQAGVAIETLPSSNLRISVHRSYSDHHAIRWLGLGRNASRIPVRVTVGSDDPGIFSTTLRTEHAHLHREILRAVDGDEARAEQIMRRIIRNARAYRFRPSESTLY